MTEIIYTPGVCNIGPEEIARRRMFGWVGTIVTVILVAALLLFPVAYLWRITVFIPAFVAATGFIQAYFKFCVGFAQAGVSNFGPLGKTETVTDEVSKKRDTKRAVELNLYALVIAILVTAIVLFI